MGWDRIAKGLKQFIGKVAVPQSLAPEDDHSAETSMRDDFFGDDGYGDERMTPYSPDNRNERSDSSLHLSC
jgi:hypothetical protein